MQRLPASVAASTVVHRSPFAFAHNRPSRAVDDEMDGSSRWDAAECNRERLTSSGERGVVGGCEIDTHQRQDRPQEAFRLAQARRLQRVLAYWWTNTARPAAKNWSRHWEARAAVIPNSRDTDSRFSPRSRRSTVARLRRAENRPFRSRSAAGLVALRALSAAVDSSTCFLISTLLLRELSRNQVSKKTLGRRIALCSHRTTACRRCWNQEESSA